MTVVSRPIRRTAAVAILAGLVWCCIAGVIEPVLADVADTAAANRQSAERLGRQRRLAAATPALRRRLEASRPARDDAMFLPAGTLAVLSAAMQDAAERLVAGSGATLNSSRTLPVEEKDGFAKPGLEVEIAANMPRLRHLLVGLETVRPVIHIDGLSLQVPENGATPVGPDGQPVYVVRLRLASFAHSVPAATP